MFDKAFELLMINEGGDQPNGGLVTDPHDEGGTTKYGISQRAHPDVDVANLTLEEAQAIYEKSYWEQFHCDKMEWPVAWVLFDCIVNHGPEEPIRWLQSIVGVTADGQMGPVTLAAIKRIAVPLHAARDMTLARRDYVETLRNYDAFKAGWCRRHLDTLIAAAQDITP